MNSLQDLVFKNTRTHATELQRKKKERERDTHTYAHKEYFNEPAVEDTVINEK